MLISILGHPLIIFILEMRKLRHRSFKELPREELDRIEVCSQGIVSSTLTNLRSLDSVLFSQSFPHLPALSLHVCLYFYYVFPI